MLDKYVQPPHPTKRADSQMEKMKVTNELVMAISDRVYNMLLHELKIERERRRILNRSPRR
jgi:hypothetical protein